MSLRNNPLIAAFFGTVVTGLGHLYLRRWLRAAGWLGAAFAASVLFVPESTVSSLESGSLGDALSLLPVLAVTAVSVLDAYRIAKERSQADDSRSTGTAETTETDDSPACPTCGRPLDPELGFCHWCSSELDDADVAELERTDETHSDGR